MDETDSDAVIVSERDMSELSPDDLNEYELDDSNENFDDDDHDNDDSKVDSQLWHEELKSALQGDFVDHGIIKSICKCRVVPSTFRLQVWKLCLNITNRSNSMLSWDKKLDLQEQEAVNKDCKDLVKFLIDSGCNIDTVTSTDNIISVVTFFCKSRALKYKSENESIYLFRILLPMNLDHTTLYNCFYAIQSRYITRSDLSQSVTNAPYNLLRLLLLYHDPELCNFLDTCKITPDMFTKSWFSSLFSRVCTPEVTCALWDIYFQRSDPFFIFFLSLVILVNAKEQVVADGELPDIDATIKVLSTAPSVLTVEDVDDFCQLASYYSDRTPSSIRRDLAACFYSGAMVTSSSKVDTIASELQSSFCIKISIPELLLSSQPKCSDGDEEEDIFSQIRYFLVDCRPAEQYNEGHLLTAFHLDATLMLREPKEFDEALVALFAAQEQAIQAGSSAGGEHLSFIGSGNEEEDSYMYMVIANLLQKRKTYISVVRGGHSSLIEYLVDVGIDLSEWIVGSKVASSTTKSKDKKTKSSTDGSEENQSKMESIMKKMAGNLLQKSFNFKEKVTKFIENTDGESNDENRAGSSKQSGGERVKQEDGAAVFSIDDEGNDADDEDQHHHHHPATITDLDKWKSRDDMKHCFECQAVQGDGSLAPAVLFVSHQEMRCLLEVKAKKRRGGVSSRHTWVRALASRPLRSVVRITSRRSFPELITFKFGDEKAMNDLCEEVPSDIEIIASDRYILPDAGAATKAIKQLIVESDKAWQEKHSTLAHDASGS